MPTRRFSSTILAGAWPQTDPAACHTLSRTQHRKAVELLGHSDEIRAAATQVTTNQAGATVDAFGGSSHRLAGTVTDHADRYFAMARASREVGHILHGLRTDLEHIDSRAHTQIDQIAQRVTGATAVFAQTRIIQVIAAARGEAAEKSATAATAIADQGANLGITTPPAKAGNPSAVPVSGPDDQIVDPGKTGPRIQAVDNTTTPQPPGVPAPTPGGPAPQQGFLDQYRDSLGQPSAPPAAPPPVPMPSPNPPPPFVPEKPGPPVRSVPMPSFGQCVGDHVKENLGESMVKDGFKSALQKAAMGAAFGAGLTPEAFGAGALPGAVLGFVGGFAQGVVLAPVKEAAKGAWDCINNPIPGAPTP